MRQVLNHPQSLRIQGRTDGADASLIRKNGTPMGFLVVTFAALAAAAATQAASGFGFALLAVPLLTLTHDVRTAVVGAGVAGVLLNVESVRRDHRHVRWRTVAALLVTAVIGMPFGLVLLRSLDERTLTIVVAVTVLGCTYLVWRQPVLSGGRAVVAAGGLAAGVLSTATGTNGPPLVAVLSGLDLDPCEFRASLAAYFSATGVLGVLAFGLAGQLTRPAWLIGAVGMTAVPFGWLLGDLAFRRLDATRFRHVVLVMLVVTSAITIMKAATG